MTKSPGRQAEDWAVTGRRWFKAQSRCWQVFEALKAWLPHTHTLLVSRKCHLALLLTERSHGRPIPWVTRPRLYRPDWTESASTEYACKGRPQDTPGADWLQWGSGCSLCAGEECANRGFSACFTTDLQRSELWDSHKMSLILQANTNAHDTL